MKTKDLINFIYGNKRTQEKKIIELYFKKKEEIEQSKQQRPNNLMQFINDYNSSLNLGYDYSEFFYQYLIQKLTLFQENQTNLLLLEAPPGSGKTFIIRFNAVFNVLQEQPKDVINANQYLFVFGSSRLKDDFAVKLKGILKSNYIKAVYGDVFNKEFCVQNSNKFILNNGVSLIFTTATSEIPTGTRFKEIYLIDYLTFSSFRSAAKKERAIDYLSGFLTRTQLKPETKIYIDNQRLGRGDLTDIITQRYLKENLNFIYIQFPYIFKDEWADIHKRQYILNDKTHIFEEGDFILKRFNQSTMAKTIANNGNDVFITQFQGIVNYDIGELIEENDFAFYDSTNLLNIHISKLIITIDTALKPKDTSDFSVISLFAYIGGSIYLIDIKRGRWNFYDLEKSLNEFLEKWKNGVNNKKIDKLIIEDTAQGSVMLNAIKSRAYTTSINISNIAKQSNIKVVGINPKVSKYQRLAPWLSLIKKHKIHIPASNFETFVNQTNVLAFKDEMLKFTSTDRHDNDDMVDTFIMACEEAYAKPKTLIYNETPY